MIDMMGGGIVFMLLFPLLMIGLLALVLIAATGSGTVLARSIGTQNPPGQSGFTTPSFSSKSCPVCHRAMQADWKVCPYDGTKAD
jgi:hypothetical protein